MELRYESPRIKTLLESNQPTSSEYPLLDSNNQLSEILTHHQKNWTCAIFAEPRYLSHTYICASSYQYEIFGRQDLFCIFLFQVIFKGNSDRNTVVRGVLAEQVYTSGIRIVPVTWYGDAIGMRYELTGCISESKSYEAFIIDFRTSRSPLDKSYE